MSDQPQTTELPTPQPPTALPPERSGFVESLLREARDAITNRFLAIHRDELTEFEEGERTRLALGSRLKHLTERIQQCHNKFEEVCEIIEGRLKTDLVGSLAENLVRCSVGQIQEVLALHSGADLIQRNGDMILARLKQDLIERPVKELADFKRENAVVLKKYRVI